MKPNLYETRTSPMVDNYDGGTDETEAEQGAVNGAMAPGEQDLVRLGKEMKAMKTNTELKQEGLIPDPIQN